MILVRAAFITMAYLLTVCAGTAFAAEPKDIQGFPACTYCNMNRQSYSHSRMLIVYDDGTAFGSCSIHCTALNLVVQMGKTPSSIRVADYYSRKLIDAETAWWVLGGAKPGVMTRRAKWAFRKEADAKKFISEHGGEPATFDDVLKATYQDMYEDAKMIRTKIKTKKMSSW
jgi:copper chaperone NosL